MLDYLAAHEVAHLVEMNHSTRFWRLVDRLCPNVQRAKNWLDVHGTDLHRYGLPRGANCRTCRRTPRARHERRCSSAASDSSDNAQARYVRADGVARGADRDRTAVDRSLSAVAAGYRPRLRRLAGKVQLTLSAYLVGFALGQIAYGPISDWYGRKSGLAVRSPAIASAA